VGEFLAQVLEEKDVENLLEHLRQEDGQQESQARTNQGHNSERDEKDALLLTQSGEQELEFVKRRKRQREKR